VFETTMESDVTRLQMRNSWRRKKNKKKIKRVSKNPNAGTLYFSNNRGKSRKS